jgi:hypothetical protein
LSNWNVSNVTHMNQMFENCTEFHRILPWNVDRLFKTHNMFNHTYSVQTHNMFNNSHGSFLQKRSPVAIRSHQTVRQRNKNIHQSMMKRSNHPIMMNFDDDHFSPIDSDHPDFSKRLMHNVRKKSPDLLRSTHKKSPTVPSTRKKRKRQR